MRLDTWAQLGGDGQGLGQVQGPGPVQPGMGAGRGGEVSLPPLEDSVGTQTAVGKAAHQLTESRMHFCMWLHAGVLCPLMCSSWVYACV